MSNKMEKKQLNEKNKKFIPSGFAINLKHYRLMNGMSSEELANELGLDHSAIIKYETGQREPKLSTVRIIAQILDVSCDDLLDNGDEYYNYNE